MCFGQRVRFGYVDNIAIGDIVIIDMLQNRDGRFINEDELIKLKKFITDPNKRVTVYINYFLGNSKLNQAYSDALKKNLDKYITGLNIETISMGEKNPIICNSDSGNDKYFRTSNTRLQIEFTTSIIPPR